MWPFKKKPIDQTPIDNAQEPEKPAEKELPELKWELSIGPWHKEFRCEHCGHPWWGDTGKYDEDPCPDCGCIGSHKMLVVRHDYEHTQCLYYSNGHGPSTFRDRGLDVGDVQILPGSDTSDAWRGIRNEKTVIWDGCSAKKDANDK